MTLADLQDEPPWVQSVMQATAVSIPTVFQLFGDQPEVTVTTSGQTTDCVYRIWVNGAPVYVRDPGPWLGSEIVDLPH